MQCKDCGSQKITWEIDAGYVIQEYDENGKVIKDDFHCDSLNCPECAICGSSNVEYILKSCENCRKCGETICGNDTEFLRCWEGI